MLSSAIRMVLIRVDIFLFLVGWVGLAGEAVELEAYLIERYAKLAELGD